MSSASADSKQALDIFQEFTFTPMTIILEADENKRKMDLTDDETSKKLNTLKDDFCNGHELISFTYFRHFIVMERCNVLSHVSKNLLHFTNKLSHSHSF